MQSVLILITAPEHKALTPDMARAAATALPSPSGPDWLADRIACEIGFAMSAGADRTGIENAVRDTLGAAPVDIAILPAEGRRRSLLVADMDSTMIGEECIDELGALTGLGAEIAAITERAMRGELDFTGAVRARVGLMKGLDAGAIDRVIAERISLTPGGRELVQTMRRHGAYTALVSGGFTAFTAHVAAQLGFDDHQGNRLVVDGGAIAGTVEEPILGRAAKVEALQRYCAQRDIPAAAAMAVGDGANDLDMLAAAGLGVAYRAKPVVAEAARVRIDHGDLTALLYLQGYRREEFTG
ncbi:MAG: phosphoserine phosphatase SerB [Hyphomicrobiales bacterium]